jgi:hypothetical protein
MAMSRRHLLASMPATALAGRYAFGWAGVESASMMRRLTQGRDKDGDLKADFDGFDRIFPHRRTRKLRPRRRIAVGNHACGHPTEFKGPSTR